MLIKHLALPHALFHINTHSNALTYKEFCVGGSKAKTVLYFSYSTARCELLYYTFIEPDTRMAKIRKAFKRFLSALSALNKTINLACLMVARVNVKEILCNT